MLPQKYYSNLILWLNHLFYKRFEFYKRFKVGGLKLPKGFQDERSCDFATMMYEEKCSVPFPSCFIKVQILLLKPLLEPFEPL